MSLLQELKRRNVFRVGIAYVVGSWLLLQFTEVLSELLNLPEEVGPIVVAAVAIGLPIVLFVAWAYELTPDGVKRDHEVDRSRSTAPRTGKRLDRVTIILLATALIYFVWESRFSVEKPAASTEAGDQVSSLPRTVQELGSGVDVPAVGNSIAVLPFENFSGNPEDQYFADGLSDTLLHKLAQISGLKVIARNSSFQFKGSNRDIREIGEILGVETVLEGSVQRSGDQVRIIAQLIQTKDGAHIWSQTFDDSMSNIFELQDQVAESIVDQFQFKLSAAERARLLRDGTDIPEAYDLVIRAMNQERIMDQMTDSRAEDDERIRLLREALALDPDYARAWAYLSRAYNGLAFASDSAQEWERYVTEAQAAADEALRLDPTSAEAYSAQGWVAHRKGERLAAARHFRRALEIDKNSLEAMSGLALQLSFSNPEEALSLLNRSHELDPTSAIVYRQKHFMLLALGRTNEAIEQIKLAIELSPTTGMYYNDLADLLEGQGRPDEGARFASQLLAQVPDSFTGQTALAEAWLAAADHERAEAWIRLILRGREDSDATKLLEVERLLAANEHAKALRLLEDVVDNEETHSRIVIRRISACLGTGQTECAVQQARQFRAYLEESRARGGTLPPDFDFAVSVAELLVSERADSSFDAKAAAMVLLESPVANGSRFFGPIPYARAGLHARAGNIKTALELLEQTLPADSPAVFNRTMFGATVEHSPLLTPLADLEEFRTWLDRHLARRQDMQKTMQAMESSGEIMSVRSAERMVGP